MFLKVKGIKCDNPNCDYFNPDVESKTYKQDWLNKPCPKCGENLLTEKDYKTIKKMKVVFFILNIILWPIEIFLKITNRDEKIDVPIEMNGTGNIDIKLDIDNVG